MNRTRFNIGDIVYFLVSDEKCIRFKGEVVEKDCEREDVSYWIEKAPKDKTYKIKFIAEYEGDKLNKSELYKHGFKGYLRHPLCNNKELIDYIKSIF